MPGKGPLPFYYHSYDLSPVKIYFTKRSNGFPQPPEFALPKAMIKVALPYKKNETPELPDEIVVKRLTLELVYVENGPSKPTVEPLTIALRNASKQTGQSERRLKNSEDFRLRTISLNLMPRRYSANDELIINKPWRSKERKEHFYFSRKVDGLNVYKRQSSDTSDFYIGSVQDEFYFARCSRTKIKTKWCAYKLRINEGFFAEVSFAHIEHNGGRDFANDRIRALRLGLCNYMKCEMVAEDGSLILSGAD